LQVQNKSQQSDYKQLSRLSPLVHSSHLNSCSTEAAKPAVTEETDSTTTSTVSTSAPSSSAEQALSTAESTLGKPRTAGLGTDQHSIQMAIQLTFFSVTLPVTCTL